MNIEEKFLTTYGLQHFVTHAHSAEQHAFVIKGEEDQKMINHAKSLIKGCYGANALIKVA